MSFEKKKAKLTKSEPGRLLLGIIEDGIPDAANRLGVSAKTIHSWVLAGRASIIGAEIIEQKIGIPKDQLRPDIDWRRVKGRGRAISDDVEVGDDKSLIKELVKLYGGNIGLSKKIGCSSNTVALWASRGRIATSGIKQVLALPDLPSDLRERLT